LWFYYNSTRFSHAGWWELPDEVYQAAGVTKGDVRASTLSSIYVARLRLDGFVSLRAGATAGEVVTKSITVDGTSLWVNANARGGTLKAELLDAATGTVIPGYSLADSVALQADSVRAKLQWQGGSDLSALAGKSVKIRFSVQNADLYSFWFEEPIATDLSVWWKFEEASGTSAVGSGTSGNTGALMNMAGTEWTAGKLGNALRFVGANDHGAKSPLTTYIAGACTLSLWMKRAGNTVPTLTTLFVGAGSGPASYFNGLLDDVRVYPRALSDGEVSSIYDAASGTPPPSITAQPANTTVNSGQTAMFSVTVSGSAPLTCQ